VKIDSRTDVSMRLLGVAVQPNSPVPDDYEMVPYFCLPSNHLAHGVIAESCRSCFDYPNALADLVVGYMGVPYYHMPMTRHPQYVTVRNQRGREMIDIVRDRLQIVPTVSSGDRKSVVMQTVEADDAGFYGRGPESPAPPFVGNLIATILEKVGYTHTPWGGIPQRSLGRRISQPVNPVC
jgi:7-hydroxymethyl chlorophyll a reductase